MAESTERVLFVHAHPDDETLFTGATIATLVASGAHVTVLTCTRGELGEVIPAELQHLVGAGLGAHRAKELDGALAALGVTDHRYLGQAGARWQGREPRRYLDSGMSWGNGGAKALLAPDPMSLLAADVGEVAADIAAAIIEVEPDVVVSYAADGGYGHPDHIRAHDATRTAAEVLHVPFYVVDSPGRRRGPVRVDGGTVLERKRAALAAHRTQVSLDGDSYSLSSGDPRPIDAVESFTRVHPVGTTFADHSLGTRVAALVLAFVLGAFTGATLTAAHQATAAVGTVTVPWGIIAGLAITAGLLAGLRLVFATRLVAAVAAIGLLAAAMLLAIQSQGGSVLVPANPAGYAWTFGPVVIAVVVLAWPRFARPVASEQDGNIGLPARKGPDSP